MKKLFLSTAFLAAINVNAQCDLTVLNAEPASYSIKGTHSFNVTLMNLGASGAAGYKIYWQQDNGTIQNIAPTSPPSFGGGPGLPVNFSDPLFKLTFTTTGKHSLKVWVTTASADANHVNDTIIKTINVFETLPEKHVLVEVFKHFDCCPCYPAVCFEDTVISKNKAYTTVNMYSYTTDPTVYNSDAGVIEHAYISGHPTPLIDRFKFSRLPDIGSSFYTDPNNYYGMYAYGEREQYYEPVDVNFRSASYNSTTRVLHIKAGAQFADNLNGDYRFNIYVVEDSIKGYQACAPDPQNYYHRHVLRAMLGGAWGKQGSLPSALNAGDNKDYEFVYTVPVDYDVNKLSFVAMVQAYDTDVLKRRILNSAALSFSKAMTLNIEQPVAWPQDVEIYPNPAKDKLSIRFNNTDNSSYGISVIDIAGKTVYATQTSRNVDIDIHALPAATYTLSLKDQQHIYSKTIIKE